MKKYILTFLLIPTINLYSMDSEDSIESKEQGLNISKIIEKSQEAIQKNDIKKLQKILSKTSLPQEQERGYENPSAEHIRGHKSKSNLQSAQQQQLVEAVFKTLKEKELRHQADPTWRRHINTRTLSSLACFIIAAGGFYASFSDQCTQDSAWYCDLLKACSTTLSGGAGVYQLTHHVKQTDSKQGLNQTLAMQLKVAKLLRDNGIDEGILAQNSLGESSDTAADEE